MLVLGAVNTPALAVPANATTTINFQGEIVETACTVTGATNNALPAIALGTYPKSIFNAVGTITPDKPVDISLTGCPVGQIVTLAFSGTTVANDVRKLDLTAGTNTATNVAIELLDAGTKTAVPFDGSELADTRLIDSQGHAGYNFVAHYISTATAVTAGEANSTATFDIVYK